MSIRKIFSLLLLVLASTSGITAAETKTESKKDQIKLELKVGVVSTDKCLSEAAFISDEKKGLDAKQNIMASQMQQKQQELENLITKLNDPDYRDGLSPEAEEQLALSRNELEQEIADFQSQSYQVLEQLYMQFQYKVGEYIASASEKVGQRHGLHLIFNDRNLLFSTPSLDITKEVIEEMNVLYKEEKKAALQEHAPAHNEPEAVSQ